MDLPLFVDEKQDERSKSEKDTVLGTKLFYSHQKFPGKNFLNRIENECRFGFCVDNSWLRGILLFDGALPTPPQLRTDHPGSPTFRLGAPYAMGTNPDSGLRLCQTKKTAGVHFCVAQESEGNKGNAPPLNSLTRR